MKMFPWIAAVTVAGIALGGTAMTKGQPAGDDPVSRHLVAEAMLTAHFVDAALKAGMDRDAINAVLRGSRTKPSSRNSGSATKTGDRVHQVEGADFAFPTDPGADSQAAPFAALLTGDQTVVVQEPGPRLLDGAVFQYVGVAGVDQPRIVQVGLAAAEPDQR